MVAPLASLLALSTVGRMVGQLADWMGGQKAAQSVGLMDMLMDNGMVHLLARWMGNTKGPHQQIERC